MLFALLALFACDDALFPAAEGEVDGEGFCAVQALVSAQCLTCHSTAAQLGDLDLEADLPGFIAATSPTTGLAYVIPGSADDSYFFRKINNDLGAGEGGVMPPTGSPDAAVLTTIRTWIDDGADTLCAGGEPPPPAARTHAVGWADPDVHGTAAKLGELACVDCHGPTLDGAGNAVSCDTCHGRPGEEGNWRTNCSFCHGDATSTAPPRQIDGSTDPSTAAFPAHRIHTDLTDFATPFGCNTCHVMPDSALSSGHVLVGDSTPGVAEVDFAGGIAAGGSWDGASCTVYCHGPQPWAATSTVACGTCHGVATTADDLSGEHEEHVDEGITCDECHDTVSGGLITVPARHVNGSVDLVLPNGMTRAANGSCSGTCHTEVHNNRTW